MLFNVLSFCLLIAGLLLLWYLKRKNFQLGTRILLSLALGVAFGFWLKLAPAGEVLPAIRGTLTFIGEGYLALLKMLVIPLILTAIIHAILNLGSGNSHSMRRISFLTCIMLLGMTAIASLISIGVGSLFHVGQGMSLPENLLTPTHTYTGLVDTLLGMLPSNPIAIMTQQNTIAIVLFAVLLGLAARMLDAADHEKLQTFCQLIVSLFSIVKKLASLVLGLTPYGVLALIATLILDQGSTLLVGMLNFIAAMYVAMIVVIAMHSIILVCFGHNPWHYFKKAYAPLFVAFTTRSSFGTLPVTEKTLRDQFHTREMTATFVPSIGATIGMNACAGIFPAMLVVMTLAILQQPLTLHLIITVMFINTIASLGISGLPGTAYIAATVTLTSLNLPYAVVALVQGVDPIIDMGRTATNVNGVMTTALVVDRAAGKEAKKDVLMIK